MSNNPKICSSCSESGKWYPNSIPSLQKILSRFIHRDANVSGVSSVVALRKNIAYNLQYIEFQSKLQSEFDLSAVVLTQNQKMNIIAGMGIIEGLLFYKLAKENLLPTTTWSKKPILNSDASVEIDGVEHKLMTKIFKVVEPRASDIKFQKMIDISKKNDLLGGKNSNIYKYLDELKNLRNKVHLQNSKKGSDTDYWNIDSGQQENMYLVLYTFLTSSWFSLTADEKMMFDFLKQNRR